MAIKPIYHRVIGIANERETSAHAEHTKKGRQTSSQGLASHHLLIVKK